MQRVDQITEFKMLFEPLLPRSFDDILLYIRSKYHEIQKLPQHRSPSERHFLLVPIVIMSEDFPKVKAKLTEALDHDYKNELIAALAAPFDHIEDRQDAAAKLRLFLSDCEGLPNPALQTLLGYLKPSLNVLVWENARWWLIHSLPRLILKPLVVLTGAIFSIQQMLGILIVTGSYHYTILGAALSVTAFQILMGGLLLTIFALSLATADFKRFIVFLAIIFLFPVFLIGQGVIWFLRKISTIPYESLIIEKRFRLKSRLGMLSSFTVGGILTSFSLLNIGLFPGSLWGQLNVPLGLMSLLILLLWFYFWNFQPLLFLESGMKIFVSLSTFSIPFKEGVIRDSKMTIQEASKNVEALKRTRLYLERMDDLTRSNRFDVFATNCFILLLLAFLVLILVEYSIIYWGLYTYDPSFFRSLDSQSPTFAFGYHDFIILSLNNLPIGGTVNIRGGTFVVECLLFSQRFLVASLLVIAIFTYSVVSKEQIEDGKERLRAALGSYQQDINQKIQTYKCIFQLDNGRARLVRSSPKERKPNKKRRGGSPIKRHLSR